MYQNTPAGNELTRQRALANMFASSVDYNDFPIIRSIKQRSFKPMYEDYTTPEGRQKLLTNFGKSIDPMIMGRSKVFKIDGRSVPNIMGKMDRVDDTNVMKNFVDYVRMKQTENVPLEISARRMGSAMNLKTDVPNTALADKYTKFLDYMRSVRK